MTRTFDKPFARIGLFHFATNHRDPIGSLTDALSKHNDIGNSLIVLPEALNNGEVYYDQPSQALIGADDILKCLAAIATRRHLVFVAGLLEPPNNSVYLIDNDCPRLMGRKRARCDPSNPIEMNDACIGALICSDAREDYERLTAKAEKSPCAHKVICIPASMSSGTFESARFEIPAYRNKYVILANANPPPGGTGSFIANKVGTKFENHNFKWRHNVIFVATWSQLDDLDL